MQSLGAEALVVQHKSSAGKGEAAASPLSRWGQFPIFPDFRSLISAARLSSMFAANMSMLTLSTPAAPRFRLTAR